MEIKDVDFTLSDWSRIQPTLHPGKTGSATWRTFAQGNIRVRMVEYSPGYAADHWCEKGHVLLVLDGELITELADGREVVLRPGNTYQVADHALPHRSRSPRGARLFIVD
jgi:hypothetical protein